MTSVGTPHPPAAMAKGTLARRLVVAVTALVAAIAMGLSGLTALSMHRILEGQLDQQLRSTAQRVRGPEGRMPGLPVGGGPGQAQGLLVYEPGFGGFVQIDRDRQQVTDETSDALASVQVRDAPVSVTLPGLGGYRLLATGAGDRVLVVGLSTAALTASMTAIVLAACLLTLLAIAIAFVAARSIVARSLRPLARVAGTAHQVSGLELRSGEVAVPVRVDAADTDPRNEVGQVGLALNHMLDHVEGALAARHASETQVRQFVADASHELRNPLAAIRGYAELTRRERDQVPATTAHALGRIESESERMSRLVDDLLLLARLDSGPALASGPVEMGALLANAVSDAEAAGPDHTWTLSLPPDDIVALGDAHRVHQVVANLLANARVHTPAGTRVDAALAREDAWAVVRITDDGPGIPDGLGARVFERFTRADASRVRTGGVPSTGLGLAIVAAVVAAHGGHVGVESRPGRTCFTVRLPLASAG